MNELVPLFIMLFIGILPFVIFFVPVFNNLIYCFIQTPQKSLFNTNYKGKKLFAAHLIIYLWIIILIVIHSVILYHYQTCIQTTDIFVPSRYPSHISSNDIPLKLTINIIFDMVIFCWIPWILLYLQKRPIISMLKLFSWFLWVVLAFTLIPLILHSDILWAKNCRAI